MESSRAIWFLVYRTLTRQSTRWSTIGNSAHTDGRAVGSSVQHPTAQRDLGGTAARRRGQAPRHGTGSTARHGPYTRGHCCSARRASSHMLHTRRTLAHPSAPQSLRKGRSRPAWANRNRCTVALCRCRESLARWRARLLECDRHLDETNGNCPPSLLGAGPS